MGTTSLLPLVTCVESKDGLWFCASPLNDFGVEITIGHSKLKFGRLDCKTCHDRLKCLMFLVTHNALVRSESTLRPNNRRVRVRA